jgi:hypothetical protein
MFSAIKKRAQDRNIQFDLIKVELAARFEDQEWKCAKTGIEFDLSTGNGMRPFGPTLDRIDSSKGYTSENVQIVCNVYNFAKNDFDDDDVLTFAVALLNHA